MNHCTTNVAARLADVAREMPERIAVVEPRVCDRSGKRRVSTRQLSGTRPRERPARPRIASTGRAPRARLALLVRPGIDFIALVFAVFKAGAVAILIDPGMGRRNLVRWLADARPQGFIAIPLVHAVRVLLRGRFPEGRWKSRPAGAGSGAALRSTSCAAVRGAAANWPRPRPTTRPP